MAATSSSDPRAILADAPHHSDDMIRAACQELVQAPDTDPETWFRAREMLALLDGAASECGEVEHA